MPEPHLMVDIETMDTIETAAVLTIGAVIFDPRSLDTEETLTDRFFVRLGLESNMSAGRTVSASTVLWWLGQSEGARHEVISGNQVNLSMGMQEFHRWIVNRETKPIRCWAKGPDFDCVILQSAMNSVNVRWPFRYTQHRCVRTITDLAYPCGDEPEIKVGDAHSAIDDAISQALLVQHCYYKLGA